MCDCGPIDDDGGQYLCPADADYYRHVCEMIPRLEVILLAQGVSPAFKVEKLMEELGLNDEPSSDDLPF